MRVVAVLTLAAFMLSGCAGSAPPIPGYMMPQVVVTAPAPEVLSFDDAAPLALYGSSPIVPLFAIPNVKTNQGEINLAFWGTKDATGSITQITQAGISGLSSTVHVFFDGSDRPVLFRDDGSGYSIRLSYDSAAQETVTVCDPSNSAVANAQIFIANGVATAGPASDGGSCRLLDAAAISRKSIAEPTNVSHLQALAKLISSGAYIAGMGFALSSILKFKAHKDNPTQVPISTPIVLLFVAAALLFLPSVFQTAGVTLFEDYGSAKTDVPLPSFLQETALPGCSTASAACPFPSPEPTP